MARATIGAGTMGELVGILICGFEVEGLALGVAAAVTAGIGFGTVGGDAATAAAVLPEASCCHTSLVTCSEESNPQLGHTNCTPVFAMSGCTSNENFAPHEH